MKRIMTPIAAVLLSCAVLVQPVLACPFCREALGGQNDMARGYFWSILLMLFTPLGILAGLGIYFYLLVRRSRRVRAAAELPLPAASPPPEVLVPVKGHRESVSPETCSEPEPESVGV